MNELLLRATVELRIQLIILIYNMHVLHLSSVPLLATRKVAWVLSVSQSNNNH